MVQRPTIPHCKAMVVDKILEGQVCGFFTFSGCGLSLIVQCLISPWCTRAIDRMHLCLSKSLSHDCPHGEIRHCALFVLLKLLQALLRFRE